MRRTLGLLACVLGLAATPSSGGWVVITMEELPTALHAGEPTTFVFTLRQHGMTLLTDRHPTVTLQAPGAGWFARRNRVEARTIGTGRYAATVTPRDTGPVEIVVDADFMNNRARLLPIPVLAAGADVPRLTAVARGQQLFVGKGCVECHVKEDDPVVYERNDVHIGPDLSGRTFPVAYLRQKLDDPSVNRVRTNDWVVMPTLGLTDDEISALVSYLNAPVSTAAR